MRLGVSCSSRCALLTLTGVLFTYRKRGEKDTKGHVSGYLFLLSSIPLWDSNLFWKLLEQLNEVFCFWWPSFHTLFEVVFLLGFFLWLHLNLGGGKNGNLKWANLLFLPTVCRSRLQTLVTLLNQNIIVLLASAHCLTTKIIFTFKNQIMSIKVWDGIFQPYPCGASFSESMKKCESRNLWFLRMLESFILVCKVQ